MAQNNTVPLPVRIISDRPAVENLAFGFDGYAQTLAGLIAGKTNGTPLVVGIHGSRGSGKTTLMQAIKARLDSNQPLDGRQYRHCKTVWFKAWKYNDRDSILAALTETIFKAMAADGFFSLARNKIDTVARRFDKSSIFASISKLVTGVDISDFFSGPEFSDALGFSETFQRFFDDLVWTFLNWRYKISGQEKPDDRMGAMVIFIDDLDRCRPLRIAQVLETIKLYLDRSGCIFVLGASSETLHASLDEVYGNHAGGGMLEKIVHVGFTIPRMPSEAFAHLFEASQNDHIDVKALTAHLPVIMPALGHNPRQFKRLVNGLNLLCALLAGAGVKIEFEKVFAWWMVTGIFGDFAADIKDRYDQLTNLREAARRLMEAYPEIPVWQLSPEQFAAQSIPEALYPCLQRKHMAQIVMKLDLTDRQFSSLSMLSGSVVLPGNKDLDSTEPSPHNKNILLP